MGYPVIHPVVQSIEHPGARGGRRFEPCRDGPNALALECSPFNDPQKDAIWTICMRLIAALTQLFVLLLLLLVCVAAVPPDSFLGWIRTAILS